MVSLAVVLKVPQYLRLWIDRGYFQRRVPVLRRRISREISSQLTRAETFNPFELAAEVGIVSKANTKADVEHALVCCNKKLRGGGHSQFIEIFGHRASRSTFEETAE